VQSLTWSTSDAVFVTDIDDEHQEICCAACDLKAALGAARPPSELIELTQRLVDRIEDHFGHEERLMRASRYSAFEWHREKHDAARKRVGPLVIQVLGGNDEAGPALVDYLERWMEDHMRTADMMLGAFLRNCQRVGRITLRAGTKPADAGPWFDSRGNHFDPMATHRGF
jgi:hemerythrin